MKLKVNRDKKEFLNFPRRLYKDDPNWVCMLDSELEAIFDPKKNQLFTRGEAIRWILKDENGKTIGRIAAFFDRTRSTVYRQKTGGIGFFEVIESREAAFTLFDACKEMARIAAEWRQWMVRLTSGRMTATGDFLLTDLCSRVTECPITRNTTGISLKLTDSGTIMNSIRTTGRFTGQNGKDS